MGLSTTLTLKFNGAAVQKGLSKVKSGFSKMGKDLVRFGANMTKTFAKVALIAAPVALTAGFIAFAKSSSAAASSVESLTSQFETLLGSSTKAKERMEEITEFAAKTPFEIEGLARTSKLLQTLGGEMLATGKGLKLVGDAAALAGEPIEEIGLHIGRVFNAITSGTSAGESVNRLQELGLITGKVKLQFEALAKAQKSGKAETLTSAQALASLQTVLSKTEGAMEKLASTTEGKMSNLSDNISQVKVAFGTGFNDGLKIAVDAMNNGIPKLQGIAASMGSMIGLGISEAVNGDTERLVKIGMMIGEAIKSGINIGMTSTWLNLGEKTAKFMEDINPIRKMGLASDESKGSAYISKNKGSVAKDQIREAADAIRQSFMDVQAFKSKTQRENVPNRPDLRVAREGESSPFYAKIDGKMVAVLERIERHLQPVP